MTGLLSVLIPDIPAGVRTQIQREKLLEREIMFDSELDGDKAKRKANNNYSGGKYGIINNKVCDRMRCKEPPQNVYVCIYPP